MIYANIDNDCELHCKFEGNIEDIVNEWCFITGVIGDKLKKEFPKIEDESFYHLANIYFKVKGMQNGNS